MADWREREVGNETRARDINEMEDGILRHLGTSGTNNRYICECSDASCMATVNLTQDEYEQIRGNGVISSSRFLKTSNPNSIWSSASTLGSAE